MNHFNEVREQADQIYKDIFPEVLDVASALGCFNFIIITIAQNITVEQDKLWKYSFFGMAIELATYAAVDAHDELAQTSADRNEARDKFTVENLKTHYFLYVLLDKFYEHNPSKDEYMRLEIEDFFAARTVLNFVGSRTLSLPELADKRSAWIVTARKELKAFADFLLNEIEQFGGDKEFNPADYFEKMMEDLPETTKQSDIVASESSITELADALRSKGFPVIDSYEVTEVDTSESHSFKRFGPRVRFLSPLVGDQTFRGELDAQSQRKLNDIVIDNLRNTRKLIELLDEFYKQSDHAHDSSVRLGVRQLLGRASEYELLCPASDLLVLPMLQKYRAEWLEDTRVEVQRFSDFLIKRR